MKNIKKSLLLSLVILIGLISVRQVIASTTYTKTEVAQHNTSSNCWAIYENGVYDITTYLNIHNQKYSDITSWCGTDMTADFDSVRKHQGEATTLLASFKVGTISTTTTSTTTVATTGADTNPQTETTTDTTTTTAISNTTVLKNPYNLLLPLILGIVLYWGSLLVFSKYLKQFNAFWNTVLLLTFLIPTFGFGIFMMLQYQFPSLMDIDFKFMYWHVELSVFMGVLGISHFLRRLKIYFMQLKQR